MAEVDEYNMTHAPPNNTDLALLNAYIDRQVPTELLRHKTRMFELLADNGLIARSVIEQRFLSRILSMYAQTRAQSRLVGIDGHLDSASLEIRNGELNGHTYVAIVSIVSKDVVFRGKARNTSAEAMESFIDTVLLTGQSFKETLERQRDEYNKALRLSDVGAR